MYNEILPFWVGVPNLLTRPNKVYRVDGGDNRYYLTINNQHQAEFYPSVTSIISATTPTPPYLVKWMCDHGKQRAEELRRVKSEYGTLLHIMLGMYLTNDYYDLDVVPTYVAHYCAEKRFDFDTASWPINLQKDMLAFHKFCEDYQLEPIAIEMPLVNREQGYWYGGAIDLVCKVTIEEKGFWGEVFKSGEKKGQPKETTRERRTTIIVDFKSGRHGFYESHEIQANMYLRMWNNSFPENPAEYAYNWRPKEWDTTPSYEVKDQTGRSAEKIPLLVSLFALSEKPTPSGRTVVGGKISRGRPLGENNIQFKSAEQLALDKYLPKIAKELTSFTPEQQAIREAAGVTDETLRDEGIEVTLHKIESVIDSKTANLNEEPIPTDMPAPEPQTFIFDNEEPPITPQEAMSPSLLSIHKEMRKNGVSVSQPF